QTHDEDFVWRFHLIYSLDQSVFVSVFKKLLDRLVLERRRILVGLFCPGGTADISRWRNHRGYDGKIVAPRMGRRTGAHQRNFSSYSTPPIVSGTPPRSLMMPPI